jgi:Domain of unknown function (DUF5680)
MNLVEFIQKAKIATYAAQGDEASLSPMIPDSKQLEYREGDFLYRDVYVGMFRFAGQEIVYQSGKAVWSMSYAGGLSPECPREKAKQIYEFLREALTQVPKDLPLRGPTSLARSEDFRYQCLVEGVFEAFHGIEEIREFGIKVFRVTFSGGLVS